MNDNYYIVNEGIITKVFIHQNIFFTSLYKIHKGKEIVIHTIPKLPAELTNHERLLSKITSSCFLCFTYNQKENYYEAYYEKIRINNNEIKRIKKRYTTGQTLEESFQNLEKTITKVRRKKI